MVTPRAPEVPVILTIAGFDPSSGAGITADIKTIGAHGCYGMACITRLTVQTTQGVSRVEPVSADVVRQTLKALVEDASLAGIKIGMLASGEVARVVAEFLSSHRQLPSVLDPVVKSSSGTELVDSPGIDVLRTKILPLATVITPNLAEAEILTGQPVRNLTEAKDAARALQRLGARNVVITGGHLAENTDLLRLESGEEIEITGPRVESSSTHGTGCAFSTAIACRLAKGQDLPTAVRGAKEYVRQAIEASYPIGQGTGPLNHLFPFR